MVVPKFIAYLRVSTQKQGRSGLGMEAQQAAVDRHIKLVGGILVATYIEVESGRRCDRPELARALAHARRSKATLLVAKLDRLSRNLAFLAALLDAGVEVTCCDCPHVNRLTLQIMAVLAEDEARRISERTSAALQALKARGVRLGSARPGHWDGREQKRLQGLQKARQRATVAVRAQREDAYSDLLPIVTELRGQGLSLRDIATRLNDQGHTTRRGRSWNPVQVGRVLGQAG
jgi:DNA invertase Pin-like site-specific DNA recombinase